MKKINKVSSRILELELEIKLIEYLKNNKIIDDGMYNYIVNKIINKINLENNKINYEYENDIKNYKLVT